VVRAPSDVAGIAAVLRANWSDPSLVQRPAADLKRSIRDFLVAVLGDEVVGCACLQRDRADSAELGTVAVHPSQQGRGVGSRLVAGALARADMAGCRRVWLATTKPGYFGRFGFNGVLPWDLPWLVILSRLPRVFRQPPARWPAVLRGRLVYIQRMGERAEPGAAPDRAGGQALGWLRSSSRPGG
jgi:N-acetylglutamate synthase-like GNAT family acetyltransferase